MGMRKCGRSQRGLSLVELMVGVAIGLFIVAGAATVVSTQLVDTRRLTQEAQVQQDLRAALDIMTREFRRAGSWPAANTSVWTPQNPNIAFNPGAAVTVPGNGTATFTSTAVAANTGNVLGFRLFKNAQNQGVIQQNNGNGGWQDVTDISTVDIQALVVSFTPLGVAPIAGAPVSIQVNCPYPCPAGTPNCEPTLQVREVTIQVTGVSISDPTVVRQMQSTVRMRNDQIVNNMANPAGPLCPDPLS
ncbi:MAG: prepilin-type N-terminal cleavage/methylation domain-containing protein [Sphingomonadales bacterium]|nr:prepilin-type N-terminal cleavage/methylation domain-containing protein [Sphingomonadales bacterium]